MKARTSRPGICPNTNMEKLNAWVLIIIIINKEIEIPWPDICLKENIITSSTQFNIATKY
jgi:hypothetical protein